MAVAIETQCLILTPPGDEFAAVRDFISKLANESTTVPIRPIMKDQSPDSESVQRMIERASMIVIDITGNDPNALYALGLAHGMRKPVLPLVQRSEGSIPSDLGGIFFCVYDPGDIKGVESYVIHWMHGNVRDLYRAAS